MEHITPADFHQKAQALFNRLKSGAAADADGNIAAGITKDLETLIKKYESTTAVSCCKF